MAYVGDNNVFDVRDARELLNQVGRLEQVNNNLEQIRGQIQNNYNKIPSVWQSNTADRESTLAALRQDLNDLEGLIKDINTMKRSLEVFARDTINASNNAVITGTV